MQIKKIKFFEVSTYRDRKQTMQEDWSMQDLVPLYIHTSSNLTMKPLDNF